MQYDANPGRLHGARVSVLNFLAQVKIDLTILQGVPKSLLHVAQHRDNLSVVYQLRR